MGRTVRSLACVVAASVLILAGVFLSSGAAGAATGGGECSLSGTANFDGAGLTLSSSSFSYNFSGALSGCNSNTTAPATGQVSAGTAYETTLSYACGTSTCSAVYSLPEPTGTGSCASSTTSGISVAAWPDGTDTVVSYSTTGALAAVELQGTVVPSVSMVLVSDTGGTPPAPPVVSSGADFPAGDGAVGQLVFSPSSPTACQTGVTSAGISGVIGLGSAQ